MSNKIIIEGEPQEVTEIREKILTEFADLQFDEGPHVYTLNGVELPSVSHVTHQFANEFDAELQATLYAEKHGETKEYWLDQWKYKNLMATTTGTLVHSFGESYGWMTNGHPELITPENRCKYIPEKNWLIPTRKKEEAVINFYKDLDPNLHFVLAETKVYTGKNKELTNLKQDYAGTFDILFYYKDPHNAASSGLIIWDFKTNKELQKEYSRINNRVLKPPFVDLYDEPLSLYTLQLSAYQLPLEDIGLKVIARRVIWLKDDGTYEIYRLRDVTKVLRETL